jgi:hypothetical protein
MYNYMVELKLSWNYFKFRHLKWILNPKILQFKVLMDIEKHFNEQFFISHIKELLEIDSSMSKLTLKSDGIL